MRQIVLDTETTGLEPAEGHRIIEIGCMEMVNRRLTHRHFHHYLQPDRKIDADAMAVHGISNEFLLNKPRFADVVDEFMDFVKDSELIIHNADFDVGFINHELQLLKAGWQPLEHYCSILDTLKLARKRHPGQRNSLDALCKRYAVDNSQRELHGALLDAGILADVYLVMTGGQVSLLGLQGQSDGEADDEPQPVRRLTKDRPRLSTPLPTADELTAHQARLAAIDKASGGECLWLKMETAGTEST